MAARVRVAQQQDVDALVELSRRVQEHLTASGSLQEFGPLPREQVSARVAAGQSWVMELDDKPAGGVFVAPISRQTLPDLAGWGIDESRQLYYLTSLMVAPGLQGRRLGELLLDAAKQAVAAYPGAVLVLDCWAGNDKLRGLYARNGFTLQGVFPEKDYFIAVFTWSPAQASGY